MNDYTIWWTPAQAAGIFTLYPYINPAVATQHGPTSEWPDGWYCRVTQLTEPQFEDIDDGANNGICINIKPGSHPTQSPTGR